MPPIITLEDTTQLEKTLSIGKIERFYLIIFIFFIEPSIESDVLLIIAMGFKDF